jgi:hypothetical protein
LDKRLIVEPTPPKSLLADLVTRALLDKDFQAISDMHRIQLKEANAKFSAVVDQAA